VFSVGVKLLTLVDSLTRYGIAKQEAPGFSRGVAHYVIQNGDDGYIFPFNGIGAVLYDEINDEILKKIEKRIVW